LFAIKKIGGEKIKKNYLIKFGQLNQTALYIIKKVIPEAHSNIYRSHSLVPFAPSMLEVCLGIMLTVTLVSKAHFLPIRQMPKDSSMMSPDSVTLTSKSSTGAFPFFPCTCLEEIVSSSFSHLGEFTSELFSTREMLVLRSLTVTLDYQSLYAEETY